MGAVNTEPWEIAIPMNRSRKILSLVLLLVGVIGGSLKAQDTLRGLVKGTETTAELHPLVGASVHWLNTEIGTITDENGKFSLPRTNGSDSLVIRYYSYTDTVEALDVSGEITFALDYYQRREERNELEDVEIRDRLTTSGFSRLDPKGVELIRSSEFRKAACCNLSESFETNPSVDASFTDAVTGTKQIKMLGLSGAYVNVTSENMPLMSGLPSVYGLSSIPSTWVKNLQLSKGTGSVVNGFEGIAGQINVDHYLPDAKEAFVLNGYGNIGGRLEGNAVWNKQISQVVGTSVMGYAANVSQLNDRNNDGFLDMPLKDEVGFLNRWKFHGLRGLMGQVNVRAHTSKARSGQLNYYSDEPSITIPYYHYENATDEIQAFAKMGYVSRKEPLASIGTQWMYAHYDQEAVFGGRWLRARQNAFYGNLITQYPLSGEKHMMKMGLSSRMDDFREDIRWTGLDSANFDRRERVSGLFAEYTFEPSERLTLVAGIRGDIHNYYGTFMTPRLHLRYAVAEKTTLRISGGRGQRSPNVLTDNLGLLVSSRIWEFSPNTTNVPGYGFLPEIGWNFGGSVTQEFTLDYREGRVRADFFRTNFTQQVVVDREDPQAVAIYPLDGSSFANSFLIEASYELIRRLDVRIAYRYYDVRTKYNSGLLLQPFNPRHRGFANIAFKTRKRGFLFDYTFQYIGRQRIPGPDMEESPSFTMMNAQVNKEIGKTFEIYIGGENLLDFRQPDPIIEASKPFSPAFDASMVWGPIFGRTLYTGFRLKINKKVK